MIGDQHPIQKNELFPKKLQYLPVKGRYSYGNIDILRINIKVSLGKVHFVYSMLISYHPGIILLHLQA